MRPQARKFGGMFKKRMNTGGAALYDQKAAEYRKEAESLKSPEVPAAKKQEMRDTVKKMDDAKKAKKAFGQSITYPETKDVSNYREGGKVKEAQMEMRHAKAMKKAGLPKSMVREEMSEAKKYARGGMPMKDGKPAFMQKKMNMGGMAKYARGGGIESRGKTKGTVIKMASGGSVSARADGCAQRGKTKGRMI